jgi:hypothetical protein
MLAPMMLTAGLIGSVTPLRAQTFRHVGAHFGCNLSNFADDPFDLARVGAQGVLSVAGPLSLYPAASVHLDRAQWQVSGLARVDLTPSSARVPFYFGGGVSYLNWDGPEARFYDVLFWGLKAGLGRYQPFVEMWFMDGIARLTTTTGGDFAVQAYVGVNLALR